MKSLIPSSPGLAGGSISKITLAARWMPAFAGMTVFFLAAPVHAEPYTYAPETCEFTLTLPGQPYTTQKCDPDDANKCSLTTSYTKVFDTDASLNVNITCNVAEESMYDRYTGDVMQATLAAMIGTRKLDDYRTAFEQTDNAKQAVIMGTGREGVSESLHIAQLWIGRKSVFTIDATLAGETNEAADQMLADIMQSLRVKEVPKAAEAAKDAGKKDKKKQEKAEETPEDKPKPRLESGKDAGKLQE